MAEVDSVPGLAGFAMPYQQYNPIRFNWPTVQGALNNVNANDRNFAPKLQQDRHVFDPTLIPTVDVRDHTVGCWMHDERLHTEMPGCREREDVVPACILETGRDALSHDCAEQKAPVVDADIGHQRHGRNSVAV